MKITSYHRKNESEKAEKFIFNYAFRTWHNDYKDKVKLGNMYFGLYNITKINFNYMSIPN